MIPNFRYRKFRRLLFAALSLCFLALLRTPAAAFPDDDGDGVDNEQERIDGTASLNADSYLEPGSTQYCVEWNGFLSDLVQIFELRNAGCSNLALAVDLRDSNGTLRSSIPATLEASQQRDIVINSLEGFDTGAYGVVCARITAGAAGALDAQLAVYQLNSQSFALAYATPSFPARAGKQFVPYNHYYPTLQSAELGRFTAGYVQISNLESSTETGELIYYDAEGAQQQVVAVSIPANGRRDIGSHFIGADTIGMIEWSPADPGARFRVVLNRYYFSGSTPLAPIIAAASLPARPGSGYLLKSAFSTVSRLAVLELSNTLGSDILVTVSLTSDAGTGIANSVVAIPPQGSRHLVLNEFLENAVGTVSVEANKPLSVLANVLEYGLNAQQGLAFAGAGGAKAGFGRFSKVSYNSFLGGCRLRLVNVSGAPSSAQLSAIRYDGTAIPISASPVVVPGNGLEEVDICGNESIAAYGEVTLTPAAPERLTGELIRQSLGAAELRTPLRERSYCLADITLSNSPLSLEVAGVSGSIMVTNTSEQTAVNLRPELNGTALDGNLTISGNTCSSVAPGNSCTIDFTPGTAAVPLTSFTIIGDNVKAVDAQIEIKGAATISLSGPAPALRVVPVSGASLSLAVTNDAGSTINASSITVSDKTACPGITVDDSDCASVAPGSSCGLLINSNTPYAPCTITLDGANTDNSVSTLIAFSYLGGLVFEESGGSGKVIADAAAQFSSPWTSSNSDISGALSWSDGVANTNAIVVDAACSGDPANCAAQRCRNISADWYLPARNELMSAAGSLCPGGAGCTFGGFGIAFFKSSSQFGETNVISVRLSDSIVGIGLKVNSSAARCARNF